jgi:hypothetical protein
VAVGEIGLAGDGNASDAVRELVRVTKPGGVVALVQLVWKAPVDEERQRVLAEHLGARPRMLVEWKRLLKAAGVEDLHTEDWSDTDTAFRPAVVKPFPDFAELFSMPEKVGILRRVWRQWGWRGLRAVLQRERAVHRLLTQERILGLNLLKGRKADRAPEVAGIGAGAHAGVPAVGSAKAPRPVPGGAPAERRAGTDDRRAHPEERATHAPEGEPDIGAADRQTEGLPLFGRRAGDVRDPAGRGK